MPRRATTNSRFSRRRWRRSNVPSIDLGNVGYVAGASLTALNTTTGFTVSFWHRSAAGAIAGSQDILRQNLSTNASRSGYFVQLAGAGQLQLKIQSATSDSLNLVTTGTRGLAGRWVHFAGTYNPANSYCIGYVNGAYSRAVISAVAMAQPATTQTEILGSATNGQQPSQVFDLQIHKTVLGPAEIPLLMRPNYRLPSLTARYFGLGFTGYSSSQVMQDESGNGNSPTTANNLQIGSEPPWRSTLA